MVRSVIVVAIALSRVASADVLDAPELAKHIESCSSAEARAPLGDITKIETIGKRAPTAVLQLTGTKARGYVVFVNADACTIIPVTGKPAGFVKGKFGGGATVAYALAGRACDPICATAISLKTADDKLVDVLPLQAGCDSVTMVRRAVFAGRDSIELGCWGSAGADPHRTDYLLDAGRGRLEIALEVAAGVAWYQLEDEGPRCQARPPGGFRVVQSGAKPALAVTTMADPDAVDAAKVAWHSGGCEATVATRRFELDARGGKFVAKGKPKLWVKRKLCTCKQR